MLPKINWIDSLKAAGIFAVVLGHIASPFGEFIFSWHMPLFFMVAGFFLKFDRNFKEQIARDSRRLLIPYFVFAVVGLLIEVGKRALLNRETLSCFEELIGIFFKMDFQALMNTYAYPLWFLPALFWGRLITAAICRYARWEILRFILSAGIFIVSLFLDLPFGLDNAFNAVLFIYLGHLYYDLLQRKLEADSLVFLMVFVIYYNYGVPAMDMASKIYFNAAVNALWAVSIVCCFIWFLKRLWVPERVASFFALWGKNTMFVFILHVYTNNVAHLLVEKFAHGFWLFKLAISVCMLHILLMIKQKYSDKWVFRYV